VSRFEHGRFVELERVRNYWAADLPVNVGINNFESIRYEYYMNRESAFEAFKVGVLNYREENAASAWATQYDFPAIKNGRVKREELASHEPAPTQGWYFNLRRSKFSDRRVRDAINYCFDFEWANKYIMYSAYPRLRSYFQNSEMEAQGTPSAEELAILEPFRGRIPAEIFEEPWAPPVSDGSGSDRNLLRKSVALLREAGCTIVGGAMMLPDGSRFVIEFLDTASGMQAHTDLFVTNLKKVGIDARRRVVDPVQFRYRVDHFDFDIVTSWTRGQLTPGSELRNAYGSQTATTQGSRNLSGISDPVVDTLIDRITLATNRQQLVIACRTLDRVLRAGRYWVPMWFSDKARIAYWDTFSRPDASPRFSSGAPETWWWDSR
jgi:microcin C transport system substrate-binding protein